MLNLIKNEYIKIFKKKSSIVIFSLFIIATIGLPVLGYFITQGRVVTRYLSSYAYDAEIQYAKDDGNDEYSDMLSYLKENKYDFADGANDWRINAIETAYSLTIPSAKVNKLYDDYRSVLNQQSLTNENTNYDENTNHIENTNVNTDEDMYKDTDEYTDEDLYEDTDEYADEYTDEYYEQYEVFNSEFAYFSNNYDDYFGFSIPCITSFTGDATARELSSKIINYVESKDSSGYFNCYLNEIKPYYDSLQKMMPDRDLDMECSLIQNNIDAYNILTKNNIDLSKDKWAYNVANNYASSLYEINHTISEDNYYAKEQSIYENNDLSEAEETNEIAKYRLENHITDIIELDSYNYSYKSNNTLVSGLLGSGKYVIFAGVIIFFIAVGIISKEFNNGTIKFLLISPVKRTSIFWSKVTTILSLLGICTIWIYLSNYIIEKILSGGAKLSSVSLLRYVDGEVIKTSSTRLITYDILSNLLSVSVFLITAIMLSSLFKNGVLSIASVVITYIVNGIATSLTIRNGFDLFKYSLLNNLDIYKIKLGKQNFTGQTATFAAIVLVTHIVIFIWVARDAFVKKDIK